MSGFGSSRVLGRLLCLLPVGRFGSIRRLGGGPRRADGSRRRAGRRLIGGGQFGITLRCTLLPTRASAPPATLGFLRRRLRTARRRLVIFGRVTSVGLLRNHLGRLRIGVRHGWCLRVLIQISVARFATPPPPLSPWSTGFCLSLFIGPLGNRFIRLGGKSLRLGNRFSRLSVNFLRLGKRLGGRKRLVGKFVGLLSQIRPPRHLGLRLRNHPQPVGKLRPVGRRTPGRRDGLRCGRRPSRWRWLTGHLGAVRLRRRFLSRSLNVGRRGNP